jgi:hypothetical protein
MRLNFGGLLYSIILLYIPHILSAQNVTIAGRVKSDAEGLLAGSNIILLLAKDSTLQKYTMAGEGGNFKLTVARADQYILKITHIGYVNKNIPVEINKPGGTVDLGDIILKQVDIKLMEVVIKRAKAPLTFKGDTLEYDIGQFKVPAGTNVEELLRQLPGIEIDARGGISSEGERIQNMLVNGKRFFDGSHQKATRNLYAEMLSTIQVYSSQTEQERLTGIPGGSTAKTMNLQLKELYSKLTFGQAKAGIGVPSLYDGMIGMNRFTDKHQFSVIGLTNNVNRIGVSDSESTNFFGNNLAAIARFGTRTTTFLEDDTPFRSIEEMFGNEISGHQRTTQGALNYNLNTEKTKVTSNYFLGGSENKYFNKNSLKSYSTSGKYYEENNDANRTDKKYGHNLSVFAEHDFNKRNKVAINLNGMYFDDSGKEEDLKMFKNENGEIVNSRLLNIKQNIRNHSFSGTAFFNHRFKKAGRIFSLSSNYLHANNVKPVIAVSQLDTLSGDLTQTIAQNQLINNDSFDRKLIASAIYSDKISKVISFNTFYNYAYMRRNSVNTVMDPNGERLIIDSLSWLNNNKISYNRVGAEILFIKNKWTIISGLTGQFFNLDGQQYKFTDHQLVSQVNDRFGNIYPHLNVTMQSGMYRISGSYNRLLNSQDPEKIQPTVINYDQTTRFIGNPDLSETIQDIFRLSMVRSNRKKRETISLNSTLTFNPTDLASARYFDENYNSVLMWENVFNTRFLTSYVSYYKSFPKSKVSLQGGLRSHNRLSKSYINTDLIVNNTWVHSADFSVRYFPFKNFNANNLIRLGQNRYQSTLQPSMQKSYHLETSFEAGYRSSQKLSFNSLFRYTYNRYKASGFGYGIPVWNVSIQRNLFKDNRGTLSIGVVDILNRRKQVSIYSSANFVTISETSMLNRYGMVSLVYRLKDK